MKPIKALIVDDALFMRKAIAEILEPDSRLQVVGTARDGLDGKQDQGQTGEAPSAWAPSCVPFSIDHYVHSIRSHCRPSPWPLGALP